jgi:hypothetical protein
MTDRVLAISEGQSPGRASQQGVEHIAPVIPLTAMLGIEGPPDLGWLT